MAGEGSLSQTIMEEEDRKALDAGEKSLFEQKVSEEDTAVFLFTSGTTSDSKIVMLSHHNIASNIRDMLEMEIFSLPMSIWPFCLSSQLRAGGMSRILVVGADNVFCDGSNMYRRISQSIR